MRIALYKGISFTSEIIKLFTGSSYSHIAMIDEYDNVIEAWYAGTKRVVERRGSDLVTNLSQDHKVGTKVDLYTINIPSYMEKEAFNFYRKQIGKKYDLWGAIGVPTYVFSTEDKNKWFCSELFIEGLLDAGIERIGLDSSKCSPGDTTRLFSMTYNGTILTC